MGDNQLQPPPPAAENQSAQQLPVVENQGAALQPADLPVVGNQDLIVPSPEAANQVDLPDFLQPEERPPREAAIAALGSQIGRIAQMIPPEIMADPMFGNVFAFMQGSVRDIQDRDQQVQAGAMSEEEAKARAAAQLEGLFGLISPVMQGLQQLDDSTPEQVVGGEEAAQATGLNPNGSPQAPQAPQVSADEFLATFGGGINPEELLAHLQQVSLPRAPGPVVAVNRILAAAEHQNRIENQLELAMQMHDQDLLQQQLQARYATEQQQLVQNQLEVAMQMHARDLLEQQPDVQAALSALAINMPRGTRDPLAAALQMHARDEAAAQSRVSNAPPAAEADKEQAVSPPVD